MEVFFYGLFMDLDILLKNGIAADNPRKGYLNDYALKIGNRASLLPALGEKAYGIVMTVDEAALKSLYAEPSVADYVSEEVTITTDAGNTLKAICYNLPVRLMTGTNEAYASSLYKLAEREGFPVEYLEKIKQMAGQKTD